MLEWAYGASRRLIERFGPWIARPAPRRVGRWFVGAEERGKRWVFDCRMCGQCVLHSTGMTCPMTCPKNLRNGPCGGVRPDGHCEVVPDMPCVWVQAFERSQRMPAHGAELLQLQPPLDHGLQGSSAWLNWLSGADRRLPPGWGG